MSNDKTPTRLHKSSYEAEYPYNQAVVTEAGHEVHFDNTPGKSRIRIAHKSGSYVEMSEDGKVVNYTVGSKQEYNKSGSTVTIDENNDVKIHGHNRVLVGGGVHMEIRGENSMVVGKDSLINVLGNMHTAVAGNLYSGVKGNANINVAGDTSLETAGNFNMKVGGSTVMETAGDHIIKAANIRLN